MGLISTDGTALGAIAFGAAIGISLTWLGLRGGDEHAMARHTVPDRVERVERVMIRETGPRVHHDHERGLDAPLRVMRRSEGARHTIQVTEQGLEAANAPLVFVDGVRVEEMPDVAALEIARVEIVKGEAARELFGPEAERGVIQIFTKDSNAEDPGG